MHHPVVGGQRRVGDVAQRRPARTGPKKKRLSRRPSRPDTTWRGTLTSQTSARIGGRAKHGCRAGRKRREPSCWRCGLSRLPRLGHDALRGRSAHAPRRAHPLGRPPARRRRRRRSLARSGASASSRRSARARASVREALGAGGAVPDGRGAARRAWRRGSPRRARRGSRRVVNATGVVLHTNLGRAPAAPTRRSTPLVHGGARRRQPRARPRDRPARRPRRTSSRTICARSPAPRRRSSSTTTPRRSCWRSTALAAGREVIVSRGELVEIGGSFRMPDVMAQERRAPARGRHDQPHARRRLPARHRARHRRCCCKVHTSNYRIVGFTAAVDARGAGRRSARAAGVPRARGPRQRRARRPRAVRPAATSRSCASASPPAPTSCTLQRRQAARRPAGRHHRRPARRSSPRSRANPLRRALRPDKLDARGARGDAAALSRRRPTCRPRCRCCAGSRGRSPSSSASAARRAAVLRARGSAPGTRSTLVDVDVRGRQRRAAGGDAAEPRARDRASRRLGAERDRRALPRARVRPSSAASTTGRFLLDLRGMPRRRAELARRARRRLRPPDAARHRHGRPHRPRQDGARARRSPDRTPTG